MNKLFQGIRTKLPEEYRDEFSQAIHRENLSKMIIIAVLLIISETAVHLFWNHRIANTDGIVVYFILFNLLILPLLFAVYKKENLIGRFTAQIVQWLYLYGLLIFGVALAVMPQAVVDSIHVYILVVFAIAAFNCFAPLESLFILFSMYLVFYLVLPLYQGNPDSLVIFRINAFLMNTVAWIFSRMVYRMRITSFVNEKIILKKNLQLRDLAMRDSMTALLNHEHTYKKLAEEIEKAKHTGSPLSIIMLDIDDFKYVNDQHGHLSGDRIIVEVARILVQTCRVSDIIGRYGGEEFFIILPETDLADSVFLAERIRKAVESTEFEEGIRITVSGGIQEYDQETVEELIRCADEQLYSAKADGKNRFICCFS